eukprot:UN24008
MKERTRERRTTYDDLLTDLNHDDTLSQQESIKLNHFWNSSSRGFLSQNLLDNKSLTRESSLVDPTTDAHTVNSWLYEIPLRDCLTALEEQCRDNRLSIYTVYAFSELYNLIVLGKVLIAWIFQLGIPCLLIIYILDVVDVGEKEYCDFKPWADNFPTKISVVAVSFFYFYGLSQYASLRFGWSYVLYTRSFKFARTITAIPKSTSTPKGYILNDYMKQYLIAMLEVVLHEITIWITIFAANTIMLLDQ